MKKKHIYYFVFGLMGMVFENTVIAQPGTTVELKKPEKYEERRLASEKTPDKKHSTVRQIYHNTITHYNYYFNANRRLNELVDDAKAAYKDTFTLPLISFYNYSLDQTAAESDDIDTIIYKCTAGILLHDLRSDWVDNLYIIMGQAYFLRKDLDSSINVFRYINYAFSPKEEGGYDILIGSNQSNKDSIFSIVTNEEESLWKKITTHLPSRNIALLWLVRGYIETGEYGKAIGLIELLNADPKFPKRLRISLQEMQAYYYYKLNIYDKSAFHLTKALDNASNKQETARWEYLIAQMYELSNNTKQAVDYYSLSAAHAQDPVMEAHATLNIVRLSTGTGSSFLQQRLKALLQLANKDKFEMYRDVIYYAAAQVAMQQGLNEEAKEYLLKSIKYNTDNKEQRAASFLLLGDVSYDEKKYLNAFGYYDSLDVSLLHKTEDRFRVNRRKPLLESIATNIQTVGLQDSLQHLAFMPATERDAALRKTLKQLLKEEGKKEGYVRPNDANMYSTTLNYGTEKEQGSIWYFNNANLRSTGHTQFKMTWGDRANVDNWRRKSDVDKNIKATLQNSGNAKDGQSDTSKKQVAKELSYERLLSELPLTPEKVSTSNEQIAKALFDNAAIFQNKLEDYPSAIEVYKELLRRFPNYFGKEEVLFNLQYCYRKTGHPIQSDSVLTDLRNTYPTGKWVNALNTQIVNTKENSEQNPVTRRYQEIYNLFIEGDFERAKAEKQAADKQYGTSYWSPQLLYIESIYYIKLREDSTAIEKLTTLKNSYTTSPLAAKAETMIDVLRRRTEIEAYLTNLNITRSKEDDIPVIADLPDVKVKKQPKDSVALKVVTEEPVLVRDKSTLDIAVINQGVKPDSVIFKIAPGVVKSGIAMDTFRKIIILADTVATAKEKPVKIQDSTIAKIVQKPDTTTIRKDTSATVRVPVVVPTTPVIQSKEFIFNAKDHQYVAIIMEKVDPVYITEAKNAFDRFNSEVYRREQINSSLIKLDDKYSLLLMGLFDNATSAISYIDKTRPMAASSIVSWLPTNKYNFSIISTSNLELLKENKDIDAYKALLQKALPEKKW